MQHAPHLLSGQSLSVLHCAGAETATFALVCFLHAVVPEKPALQRHMPLPGVVCSVDLGLLQYASLSPSFLQSLSSRQHGVFEVGVHVSAHVFPLEPKKGAVQWQSPLL